MTPRDKGYGPGTDPAHEGGDGTEAVKRPERPEGSVVQRNGQVVGFGEVLRAPTMASSEGDLILGLFGLLLRARPGR
ncbi:MAG: hypothetical protein CM1200mP26_14140 [Acidimicrobiales bacterium]|nr:MAG: hypothetical protein CM1200mP26_14140 [Acidimicrobiales bacterium]